MVLRPGDDRVFLRAPDSHLRLPQVGRAARDAIRENMQRIAAENGIQIEFVLSKKRFRKEQRVKEILEKRGEQNQ